MHPERLYLQEEPYTRVHVEIDRIEGADLPDFFIDELKAFLGEHCRKPEGIEVVLDAPIPVAEVEGIPLSMASLLCIDGPANDDRPSPAYLHLFVYSGKGTFQGATRNPRVVPTCLSGIFWNVDYARYFPDKAKRHMLRHELGHILRLCGNPDHGDGIHCRKSGCLMCSTPDLLSEFGGLVHLYFREHRLCQDCQRDLERARHALRDDNLSFAGPFLVRQEDGYSVASLPYYDTIVGAFMQAEFDWRKALTQAKAGVRQVLPQVRKEVPEHGHKFFTCGFYHRPQGETDPVDLERDIAGLSRAEHDPSVHVRRFAAEMLKDRQEALAAGH